MTDLEKAARLTLEAMGLIGADLVCDAAHHKKADRHGIGEPCPIQARWHHAFSALRQALNNNVEQPAQYDYRIKYDRPCYKCRSNLCPGNCKEPEHLQQPAQQKPVEGD